MPSMFVYTNTIAQQVLVVKQKNKINLFYNLLKSLDSFYLTTVVNHVILYVRPGKNVPYGRARSSDPMV